MGNCFGCCRKKNETLIGGFFVDPHKEENVDKMNDVYHDFEKEQYRVNVIFCAKGPVGKRVKTFGCKKISVIGKDQTRNNGGVME